MVLPIFTNLKSPIMQELAAVGGADHLKFLYLRLLPYFPALSDAEINNIKSGRHNGWRNAVQKAGKSLETDFLIKRNHGFWVLTDKGRRAIEDEFEGFAVESQPIEPLTHQKIQSCLIEIGSTLGFYAEKEFAYFDVIWKKTSGHSRISHVFEVQSKGNIDSAFAKLKRAFEDQRSKPFLVIAGEGDIKRARLALTREFSELAPFLTILSFNEVEKIHTNLCEISAYLPEFLEN